MTQQKVAILGAGISGLTTAIALHNKGIKNSAVYERRSAPATMGAGIVLWANASKILDRLQLLSQVELLGGKPAKMQRWSHQGEQLGELNINTINDTINSESYSISRADLLQILLQKVKELNIPIHYNHTVVQLNENNGIVSVLFKNSRIVHSDIILGADGRMNSIARQYVNETNSPIYQNFVNWIGILESKTPLFPENSIMDYWGVGERFGIVPINQYKGYWAGGKSMPENVVHKPTNNKPTVLNLFGLWSPKIKEVVEQTPDKNIQYIKVYDHNPIPKWYKNNVCLIGDAAHAALPTSGQGACQAIEDAWHIASALHNSETITEAFQSFQKVRIEKTTSITMAGRGFAKSLFNIDPLFCAQRNENAKNIDGLATSLNIAKLWKQNLPL